MLNNLTAANPIKRPPRVAIIGGGTAGSTVAIRLAEAGVEVHLFEKNASLINSPPMCHLHAGGNLYREISDEDCKTLMRQCIDIAKLYPESIDVRPTVITVPKRDSGTASALLPRLHTLRDYYQALVAEDASNQLLGDPAQYFQVFEEEELAALSKLPPVAIPTTTEEWLIPVTQLVALEKLQLPLIAVQEYGWNIFRLAAAATLRLANLPTAQVYLNTAISQMQPVEQGWQLSFTDTQGEIQTLNADFVVNACGFRTGIIDDQAGVKVQRMVEFKASYLSEWRGEHSYQGQLPEIIFHGERGTPHGMAQFTPYPQGIFQLHGMTESITLFKDGLTHSSDSSSQPPINPAYLGYIEQGWDKTILNTRTQNAIEYVSEFIPSFAQAVPVDNALYGGQQVPSEDITTRVADLQVFANKRYAIAENVKANSALDVADGVVEALITAQLLPSHARQRPVWQPLAREAVDELAAKLAAWRQYPDAMAKVNHALVLPSA